MAWFKQFVLKDSIEIKTSPEKIWEFFTNLDKNYKAWHPEHHVVFQWTKGKPMETGSHCYAEEVMNGKLKKFIGIISEVIPNRKIVFKCSFPVTLVSPYFEWKIEPKGSNSVFTVLTIVRCERFYRIIMRKKGWNTLIESSKKHLRDEMENLKSILEM